MKRYPCRAAALPPVQPVPQPVAELPRIQRYAHPIETRPSCTCAAQQRVLCTMQMQTQLLCAIKAELDEVLALLQAQQT